MKPYYEHAGITIYHGDCRSILPSLETQSLDMVFADPFYVPTNQFGWKLYDEFYWSFNRTWMEEIKRLVKPSGHTFISFSSEDMARFEGLIRDVGLSIMSRIVWHYRNAGGRCAHKDAFGKTYEFIFHMSNGAKLNFPEKWDDKRFDVWTIAIPQTNFKDGKFHPYQKPLDLLDRLLTIGSFECSTILDAFMGGGTTLLAAQRLKRKAVGIELEERYCEIAAKRLSQEVLDFEATA